MQSIIDYNANAIKDEIQQTIVMEKIVKELPPNKVLGFRSTSPLPHQIKLKNGEDYIPGDREMRLPQ